MIAYLQTKFPIVTGSCEFAQGADLKSHLNEFRCHVYPFQFYCSIVCSKNAAALTFCNKQDVAPMMTFRDTVSQSLWLDWRSHNTSAHLEINRSSLEDSAVCMARKCAIL